MKRKKPSRSKPVIKKIILKPLQEGTFVPKLIHRDYRIVLNDVWMEAIRRDKRQGGIPVEQRDVFENLLKENPIASLIRALGLYETRYYETHGTHMDAFERSHWLMMWNAVRVLLSTSMRDPLDGATLYRCLECLAKNAGFKEDEYA